MEAGIIAAVAVPAGRAELEVAVQQPTALAAAPGDSRQWLQMLQPYL
jgi:hypothetical protein